MVIMLMSLYSFESSFRDIVDWINLIILGYNYFYFAGVVGNIEYIY